MGTRKYPPTQPALALATLATLLLGLAAGPAPAADIYKWTDAQGKVHFSDIPPPGDTKVKTLKGTAVTPVAPAADAPIAAPAAEKSLMEKDLEFRRRVAEKQEAADKAKKEAAANAARQKDCQNVRNQLRALESGRRMSRINDQGEPIPIDDTQRQADIEQARQYLQTNCK